MPSLPILILYYGTTILLVGFVLVLLLTAIPNILSKVPFVPSNNRIIKHVVKLAKLKKGEKVYDLGCGDGRFLIEAHKKTNTKAIGYENALLPYLLSKFKKWISGADIEVRMKNFFQANLAKADVIYCYLGPDIMPQIAKKITDECRKGTRIYSHTFKIKSLKPSKIWPKDKTKKLPSVYLYEI